MQRSLIFVTLCILLTLCTSQRYGERRRRFRHRHNIYRAVDEEKTENDVAILSELPEGRAFRPNSPKNFWVSDGTKEIQIEGSTVHCRIVSNSGKTHSALWKDDSGGMSRGEHYWEIHIERFDDKSGGGISVGLTNAKEFKNGKGLMYSGNLENGQAALVDDYGPRFKSGDTIGILVSYLTEQKLKLYFYYNKRSLGLAYEIYSDVLQNAVPVISFTSSGSASITKEIEIPTRRMRDPAHYSGIEGHWKILPNEIFFNGERFKVGFVSREYNKDLVTLELNPRDNDNYVAAMQIVNFINFNVKRPRGSWKTSPSISTTRIEVTDYHLRKLENNIIAMLNNGDLSVSKKNLKLENGNNKVSFQRHEPIPETVTKNPFDDEDEEPCTCSCLKKSKI